MNNATKSVQTLADRLAAIEARKAELAARCDRLVAASLEQDKRTCELLGR